jgi:GNAT superfamily N-acetyltransferase
MSTYRITEVDASDDDVAEIIHTLNNTQEQWPKLLDEELDGHHCYWWLAFAPVTNGSKLDMAYVAGFAGIVPAIHTPRAGYFKRVLVTPDHQGHGLQLRFMRALERKARAVGWEQIVSETTDAVYSANNFVRSGYEIFDPEPRWAFENSIYWRKKL